MLQDPPAFSLLQDPGLLLLTEVLELPREEHAAFVRKALEEKEPGSGDLLELLNAHYDSEAQTWPQPSVGAEIDGFTLEKRIGRGGFAEVWLAHQRDGQDVALKIARPAGSFTAEFFERFRREADVLSTFDHPGIVKLVETGRGSPPYLALEYIDGLTLVQYVQEHDFSLRQRVELLIQVADAVQYFHERGVVHRDLKPENILVADGREGPEVRIIDFGIACFFEHDAFSDLGLTMPGERVASLAYAAPEQLRGREQKSYQRPGAPTDVFALGRLLFELLIDEKAIPDYGARGDAAKRVESRIFHEPAPSPLARARESSRDRPEVPRPLDLISRRASELAPDKRYPTAAAFRDDLSAWSEGRRISARPPALWVQASRVLRKQKKTILTGGLLLLLLGTYAVTAHLGERAALVEKQRLERTIGALKEHLTNVDTIVIAETLRSDFDEQLERKLDAEFQGSAQDFLGVLDFTSLARSAFERGYLQRAEESFLEALADDPLVLGKVLQFLTEARWKLGLHKDALGSIEKAWTLRSDMLGPNDPQTLESLILMGQVLSGGREYAKAKERIEDYIRRQRLVSGADSEEELWARSRLSQIAMVQGRFEDALALQREVVEAAADSARYSNKFRGVATFELGQSYEQSSQFSEAIKLYRRAYKILSDDPELATTMSKLEVGMVLGRVLAQLAHLGDASHLEEASALLEANAQEVLRRRGDEHGTGIAALNALGVEARALGDLEAMYSYSRRVYEGWTRLHGTTSVSALKLKTNVLIGLVELDRFEEADAMAQDIEARALTLIPPQPLIAAIVVGERGRLRGNQGDFSGAEPFLLRAAEQCESQLGSSTLQTLQFFRLLAGFYEEWHREDATLGKDLVAAEWRARLDDDVQR